MEAEKREGEEAGRRRGAYIKRGLYMVKKIIAIYFKNGIGIRIIPH